MTEQLYTQAEQAAEIQTLDCKLAEGFTQGRMDTGMSEQEWRASMVEVRKQRDYYYGLWNNLAGNLGGIVAMLPEDNWIG